MSFSGATLESSLSLGILLLTKSAFSRVSLNLSRPHCTALFSRALATPAPPLRCQYRPARSILFCSKVNDLTYKARASSHKVASASSVKMVFFKESRLRSLLEGDGGTFVPDDEAGMI